MAGAVGMAALILAATTLRGDPMSPKCHEVWNDAVQAAIDARIEKYRFTLK